MGVSPLQPLSLTDYNENLQGKKKNQLPEESEKYKTASRLGREINVKRDQYSDNKFPISFYPLLYFLALTQSQADRKLYSKYSQEKTQEELIWPKDGDLESQRAWVKSLSCFLFFFFFVYSSPSPVTDQP